MGNYLTTRSDNTLTQVLQASSSNDPVLDKAISEYKENKEILLTRNDINNDLREALLHSLNDEVKLVETTRQVLLLQEEKNELKETNNEMKCQVKKLKLHVEKYKNQVETLSLVLCILMSSFLLLYLLNHIFFFSSTESSKELSTRSYHQQDDYFLMNKREFLEVFDTLVSSTKRMESYDINEFKTSLWNELENQCNQQVVSIHDANKPSLYSIWSDVMIVMNNKISVLMLTLSFILLMILYNWKRLGSSVQFSVSASLAAVCYIIGFTLFFDNKNEILLDQYLPIVLSSGCLFLSVAVNTHQRRQQHVRSTTTSDNNMLMKAFCVLVLSHVVMYRWVIESLLFLGMSLVGGVGVLVMILKDNGFSFLAQEVIILSCSLIMWYASHHSVSIQRSTLLVLEQTSTVVAMGVVVVYMYAIWKALLKYKVQTLHTQLSASTGLVVVYLMTICAFVISNKIMSCSVGVFGIVCVILLSFTTPFVLHPVLVCSQCCILLMVHMSLRSNNNSKMLCQSLHDKEGLCDQLIDVVMGPLGILIINVVSMFPLTSLINKSSDTSSLTQEHVNRHHRSFSSRSRSRSRGSKSKNKSSHVNETTTSTTTSLLWVYSPLYTPNFALNLNLIFLVLAYLIDYTTLRYVTIIGLLLWICHQGYSKYEINFVLAIFFIVFGSWITVFSKEESFS